MLTQEQIRYLRIGLSRVFANEAKLEELHLGKYYSFTWRDENGEYHHYLEIHLDWEVTADMAWFLKERSIDIVLEVNDILSEFNEQITELRVSYKAVIDDELYQGEDKLDECGYNYVYSDEVWE